MSFFGHSSYSSTCTFEFCNKMSKKPIIYVLRYAVMEEYTAVGLNLSVVEGFMCTNLPLMLCAVGDSSTHLSVTTPAVEKGTKNYCQITQDY